MAWIPLYSVSTRAWSELLIVWNQYTYIQACTTDQQKDRQEIEKYLTLQQRIFLKLWQCFRLRKDFFTSKRERERERISYVGLLKLVVECLRWEFVVYFLRLMSAHIYRDFIYRQDSGNYRENASVVDYWFVFHVSLLNVKITNSEMILSRLYTVTWIAKLKF